MTRSEFLTLLDEILQKVRDKFIEKNVSYGAEEDVFHNFRSTARRVIPGQFVDEYEDMYRVLLCYQDKHRVALASLGLEEPEFEERVIDDIVYDVIAIAMKREKGGC